MTRRRAPKALRKVWYAVAVLSVILVIALAGAGYEINHLRTQVDHLNTQVDHLKSTVTSMYLQLLKLSK
jgi:outer membrane murein-binding lipoprotein Lpp